MTSSESKNMKFRKVTVKSTRHFSKWENPTMTNYQMACCDCGLVHTIHFQVVEIIKRHKNGMKTVKELPKKKYQVLMKAKRNEKRTKQLRKNHEKRK